MKDKTLLGWLTGSLALAVILCPTAAAQPVPDLSTPTNVVGSCNTLCTITGGVQADRNLFHSFEEFSIPTRGGVRFDNAADIINIFSRVTGDSSSNIDGLLRTNGAANVFLLNPNGILFGPNARLNIGGSFVATTADSILFDNNLEFSAGDRQTPSLLTVSVPIGLQYGFNQSGQISVDNSALGVGAGQSLILAGRGITINNGFLNAGLRGGNGRIELGSVSGRGIVGLNADQGRINLNFSENLTPADIVFTNNSTLDVTPRNADASGGDIVIHAQNLEIADGSQLQAGIRSELADRRAGNITINTAGTATITGVSQASRASGIFNRAIGGAGDGGDINIQAARLIVSDRVQIIARTTGFGNARDISISTDSLSVTSGGLLRSITSGQGDSGDVIISASEQVEVVGTNANNIPSSIDTRVDLDATGNGGDVIINARRVLARDGGQIGPATFGFGNSGNLRVIATDSVEAIGRTSNNQFPSGLGTQVERSGGGNGGDIWIETRHLSITDGASVTARSFGANGQANAGNVTVIARERVEIIGVLENNEGAQRRSGLFTQVGRQGPNDEIRGDAGNISIATRQLVILDGGNLNSRNSGPGRAGNITVTAESIELSGANNRFEQGSDLTAESIGTGDAGNLILDTESLTIQDGGRIRASTLSGRGGNVSLQNLRILRVTDGEISAATETGQAGNLSIDVSGDIELADNARLLVEATDDQGRSGSLFVTSNQLSLQNGSRISASNTSGRSADITIQGLDWLMVDDSEISASTQTGRAGNLNITSDVIWLDNEGRFSVAATAGGRAGGLSLDAQQFTLRDGASINLNSTGDGLAGDLDVAAQNIVLANRSELTANTESGRGANIQLRVLDTLRLGNGSQISALTQDGSGGQLNLNGDQRAANQVEIGTNSSISTEAIRTGDAGNLVLNMRRLTVEDGGEIAATTDSGRAGDIVLRGLDQLQVNNGRVSASTQTGRAGNLRIRALDSVELSGEGGLLVQAQGRQGIAGNLSIRADRLIVQDGASATVSSPNGQAGSLNVTANDIRLNRGFLTAETGLSQADGAAEINLQNVELLVMEDNSQISAEAFESADGGNVTIDAEDGFLIALPDQDSNIIARADRGNGGNISIAAQSLFNFEVQEDQPITNDIDASSQAGVSGNVTILEPDVDPSRGLAELPSNVVDASDQIAQTCSTGGVATEQGEFVITGRGGLPSSPNEIHSADGSYVGLVTNSFDGNDSLNEIESTNDSSALPPRLVEAQGWRVDDEGKITLVATMPVTPYLHSSGCIR